MMQIVPKIKKLRSLGLPILVRRIYDRKKIKAQDQKSRQTDLSNSTFHYKSCQPIVKSCFDISNLNVERLNKDALHFLFEMYTEHRFDILGSSWLSANFGVSAPGFMGASFKDELTNLDQSKFDIPWIKNQLLSSHQSEAQKVSDLIQKINAIYQPIDWQREIKTGFRYDVKKWYKDNLSLGQNQSNTDLKVARELSRFHHLPQLAIIAHCMPEHAEKSVNEFMCQSLDFIASNPPRMGVHWLTTMDVSIRSINMVIGYDLIKKRIINDDFHQVFSNAMFEHGKHIFENLENKSGLTNNHYFSNLLGLIVLSAYLPQTNETAKWLQFGYSEFIEEYKKQFLPDGGNFEGSSTYHALGIEMAIIAVYFLCQLDENQLALIGKKRENIMPDWMMYRLIEGIMMLENLVKPNGNIVQFGDNDSGSILKFFPQGCFVHKSELIKTYLSLNDCETFLPDKVKIWDENYLNYNSILAMSQAVFGLDILKIKCNNYYPEFDLFETKFKQSFLTSFLPKVKNDRQLNSSTSEPILKYNKEQTFDFFRQINLNELSYKLYRDVGYLIIENNQIHLAIKIGNQHNYVHSLGHCHNDILSFELTLGNQEVIIDPGTFIYTPSRKIRDEFRSVLAHSTISVQNEEQNRWFYGSFWNFNMLNEVDSKIISIENDIIVLQCKYRNIVHIRKLSIHPNQLIVTDQCNHDFIQHWNDGNLKTAGYGKPVTYPKTLIP